MGAGLYQAPLIQYACQGHHVTVCSNNAQDIAAQDGHAFFPVSTADIDGITKLAIAIKPDGILTTASDVASHTLSKLPPALKSPLYEPQLFRITGDKLLLRQHLAQHQLSAIRFTEKKQHSDKDWLIKPRCSSGGRGIQYASLPILKSSDYNTYGDGVFYEQILKGSHHGAIAIVHEHRLQHFFVTNKEIDSLFRTVAHRYPATTLSEELHKELHKLIQKFIDSLPGSSYLLDIDLIYTGTRFEIIEAGARLSGNGLTELIIQATGFPLYDTAIRWSLGNSPIAPYSIKKIKPAMCRIERGEKETFTVSYTN